MKEILNELKKELNISEKIRLEIKPMKTKAASFSFKTNTIRINKNLIKNLDLESIKYLILHELIHYKTQSKYHNDNFYKQLYKKISKIKAQELDKKIITALFELNGIYKY